MKLCLITNYSNRAYVNESLIFDKLIDTLNISTEDIFNILDVNSVYKVNKKYTHSLILFDYKSTSISPFQSYLSEVKIPKIFIIDTIPQFHKELDIKFSKDILNGSLSQLTLLSISHQTLLYEKYADGFVFYNKGDINLFSSYYNLNSQKPAICILPSLGSKQDIKINFENFNLNKNIGFNGSPSYSNGLFSIASTLMTLPQYHMNLYGSHGRNDLNNETLINNITYSNPNIKFKGKLKNYNRFFNENHIYHNITLYDSCNYFTIISLLNGVVPILSKNSNTLEYIPSYPFTSDHSIDSIQSTLSNIINTPKNELKDILNSTIPSLQRFNDEDTKTLYFNFLNSF
tara:strand:+ start:41 stop:1075 length:1035 start_codon:yes stop_codon:yes gene_type:complete